MRSGWKRSKFSSFSPVEANRIGLPVTALTDSAAPPRASPSSLERIDAVELRGLGELLGDVDGVLAGHGVDDEQHVGRPDGLLDLGQLGHQRLVDVQAAGGVDDQHVLAVALGLVARPGGDLDRVGVGAALVDGRAGLARRP